MVGSLGQSTHQLFFIWKPFDQKENGRRREEQLKGKMHELVTLPSNLSIQYRAAYNLFCF